MSISIYKIDSFISKLLKKDYYYLITMSVYHIELILFGIIGFIPKWYNYHTFFPLYFDSSSLHADFLNYEIGFNALTIFFTLIILILDFTFLFLVRNEIKIEQEKKHTVFWFYPSKKMLIPIEILIFYMSLGNPIMRMILYFVSLNTIQIFITYRFIMKYGKIIYLNKLFLIGSYLYIIMLTIAPIHEMIFLLWNFGG
jgi:hypothetical protein